MKILLVSETLVVGGAETFVVRLANALCTEHEVRLFVFYKELINEKISSQLNGRVKLITSNASPTGLKAKFDSGLLKLNLDYSAVHKNVERALGSEIKQFRPDIVHSHLFKTDYVVSRVRLATGEIFKHIVTMHGDYSPYFYGNAGARMKNIKKKLADVIRSADHIVCICNEHLEFFKNNFPESLPKTSKVYNGYLPTNPDYIHKSKQVLGLPREDFIFMMVSRGVQLKGWQKAVDAFKDVNLSAATLVLVGQGDYLDELKAREDHPRILFAGFTANPVEYIQHADVCLLPSLFPYESLPTVVMEYLYCQKPVVATQVGEIPEMITVPGGDKAGILLHFENKDIDVKELAAAMTALYNERPFYEQLKSYTGPAFSKFDMQTCVQQYLKIYKTGAE